MTDLVIGANGGIGYAVVKASLAAGRQVIAISRTSLPETHPNLHVLRGAESEADISDVIEQLTKFKAQIHRVIIATGVLHQENSPSIFPEKRLEDINTEQFQASLLVNTILPALWIAKLLPILRGKEPCVIAALSARVGSIGDNRLGGWYSYRASKAALNMTMKTAAVEYGRRARNVKLLAFHPGTTDTPLSKPFQANVPSGKLFTPEFVANQLLKIIEELRGYSHTLGFWIMTSEIHILLINIDILWKR